MKIDDDSPRPGDAEPTEDEDDDPEAREKVIVRSNGTVVYVGKDMAYQFWKSGCSARTSTTASSRRAWTAARCGRRRATPSQAVAEHPAFGDAAATYNVIDVRQSYLQKLLKQALTAIGHPQEAERLNHFSYEMVALSHATAQELGFAPDPDSEDAKKPFVEVSGRKGLGVKADDLIDRVIDKALGRSRPPPARSCRPPTPQDRRADRRRRGALLPDQVLAHQGHRVRHRRGAQLRGRKRARTCNTRSSAPTTSSRSCRSASASTKPRCWRRCPRRRRTRSTTDARAVGRSCSKPRASTTSSSRWCGRSNSRCWRSTASGWRSCSTRSTIARQILNEERDDVRRWRAAAVAYYRQQLTRALDLMGVAVPPECRTLTHAADRDRPEPHAWTTTSSRSAAPAASPWRSSLGSETPEQILRARRRPDADRRRRRRSDALRRSAARHVPGRRNRAATSSRSRCRAPRSPSGIPVPGDLPRHAGAERRDGRHAGPGHPEPGHRRARALRAASRATHIAHEVWVAKGSKLSALLADHMEDGETCHVNSRHHQAVKQVGDGLRGHRDVARRRDRGDGEAGRAVLHRGAVASRELLAHRRVPRAVRRPGPGR